MKNKQVFERGNLNLNKFLNSLSKNKFKDELKRLENH
jgi:hypothetical protein